MPTFEKKILDLTLLAFILGIIFPRCAPQNIHGMRIKTTIFPPSTQFIKLKWMDINKGVHFRLNQIL